MTQPWDDQPLALLWDLDNVTPRMCDLAEFALTILHSCPPASALYAAGSSAVYRAALPILEPLGFSVCSGGRRRNGADQVRLEQGRHLRMQGTTQFIVVSHDHAFARLAQAVETMVLVPDPSQVSHALRDAAIVEALGTPIRLPFAISSSLTQ